MSEKTSARGPEKIDILSFINDLLNRLKRFWWVIVLMTLFFGALFYFRSSVTYTPSYTADATVAVELVNSGNYSNDSTAELMSSVFPHLISSGILSNAVKSDLGVNSIPGNVSVSNIKGTNLLTVTVKGRDAEQSYATLQAVLKNFPAAAQYVVGQTRFTLVDDSGVPTDTGRTSVVRGSVKKGLLIGFGIGVILLIIYTLGTRTIRTEKELKSLFNVPFLGTLPFFRRKAKKAKKGEKAKAPLPINMLSGTHGSYEESMRLIRTRIEHELPEGNALMVTSSLPGEGKSTVAANLAIAMAKKGRKVILADCDLRNPSQQEIFGIEGEYPGIEAVLRGQASLSDAIVEIKSKGKSTGLFLLPGKPQGAVSSEILGSDAMARVKEEMQEIADLIIFDTPPSAMLMDAMFLTEHIDGVVYVVLADYAKRRVIYRGLEELEQDGIPILGCVLNGGRVRSSSYGGYGYGSKYYTESEKTAN